jgi:hypothetical protein
MLAMSTIVGADGIFDGANNSGQADSSDAEGNGTQLSRLMADFFGSVMLSKISTKNGN